MTESQPPKPLRFVVDLERRIEEAFSELIHEPWGKASSSSGWQPAIDIYETDDAYFVVADLPGVSPDNIVFRMDGTRLSIHGTRESTTWVQHSGRTLRVERAGGDFCRAVDLESDVDLENIEKRYEDGILRVRLAKRQLQSPKGETTP